MASSSDVNAFLYSDEENGVIMDAGKEKDYYIINDPFKKKLISLESMAWKEEQLEKLMVITGGIRRCVHNLFTVIPLYLQNCSPEIIEKHTPHQFEDYVVLYDFTLIDLFLIGIMNHEIKKLFQICENETRRFMIFLSLNHQNATEKRLSSHKITETEAASAIETNNVAIRKQNGHMRKTKHIINTCQYKYNNIQIGEIRIITSPNYIIDRFTTSMQDGIKFFLKMNLYTNYSVEYSPLKQRVITRLVPLNIFSVNRDVYDTLHLFQSFNDDINKQTTSDDKRERLKTNCNLLIGVIPDDYNQIIDFPIFSSTDRISVSLIVSYLGRSRVIKEEQKIEIGKMKTDYSKSAINEIMALMINLIKCKLNKTQDIDEYICMSENADLISSFSFKSMYKPSNMEEMYPIQTQLRISDLKYYSESDIAMIINKKRYELQKIITPSDGSDIFLSGSIMGFLSNTLKCNGKIWIDCYWWLNNWIAKTMFDQWHRILSDLSLESKNCAIDFYYNRDLYVKPHGMSIDVHKQIRGKTLQQFTSSTIMKKHIQYRVFHDILERSSTRILKEHHYDIFSYASRPSSSNDDEIKMNTEMNTMYQTTLYQHDLSKTIRTVCDNALSIASSGDKIPINAIFTNFSVEIDIDRLRHALGEEKEDTPPDKRFIPDEIFNHISSALDMISLFKKNNHYVINFESQNVPEVPRPFCSSSSSNSTSTDDLHNMVAEELAAQTPKKTIDVKIIMIRNGYQIFK